MSWRIGGAIRTGARFAREKQVLRCAQNDNQKSKSKSKSKKQRQEQRQRL
jgi:hypothetical protein